MLHRLLLLNRNVVYLPQIRCAVSSTDHKILLFVWTNKFTIIFSLSARHIEYSTSIAFLVKKTVEHDDIKSYREIAIVLAHLVTFIAPPVVSVMSTSFTCSNRVIRRRENSSCWPSTTNSMVPPSTTPPVIHACIVLVDLISFLLIWHFHQSFTHIIIIMEIVCRLLKWASEIRAC